MIKLVDDVYQLCTEKVNYTQDGQTIEKYVGSEGHDWWIKTEKLHENIIINEFIPITPTPEQQARFDEVIAGTIEGFQGELSEYVETGEIPEKPIEEQPPVITPTEVVTLETLNENIETVNNTQSVLMLAMADLFEALMTAQIQASTEAPATDTTIDPGTTDMGTPLTPEEIALLNEAMASGELNIDPTQLP